MNVMDMILYQLEGSVQTGDSRNVFLWIILAAIALILLVLCTAMSVMKKKETKKSDNKKKGKHKK